MARRKQKGWWKGRSQQRPSPPGVLRSRTHPWRYGAQYFAGAASPVCAQDSFLEGAGAGAGKGGGSVRIQVTSRESLQKGLDLQQQHAKKRGLKGTNSARKGKTRSYLHLCEW
eukprot:2034249-Rhodomonas_salina.3